MQILKVVLLLLLLQAETHFRKAEKLLSLGAGTRTSNSPSGGGAPAVAAIIRTGIERWL